VGVSSEQVDPPLSVGGGRGRSERVERYGGRGQVPENFARYEKDAEETIDLAKDLQKESAVAGRRALRLHLGEIFLEMAIVFSSLAILTGRRAFWWSGMAGGAIGFAVAATVFVIR